MGKEPAQTKPSFLFHSNTTYAPLLFPPALWTECLELPITPASYNNCGMHMWMHGEEPVWFHKFLYLLKQYNRIN